MRLQQPLHALRHRVEAGGDRIEQRAARHVRLHREITLAHARRGGLERLEVAPQRPRPAPQDCEHRERHQREDDGVVHHQVFVGADPLDAQRPVRVLDAPQVHGAAAGPVAEGDVPLRSRSFSEPDMKISSSAFSIGTLRGPRGTWLRFPSIAPASRERRLSVMMRSARSNATPARARCCSACNCAMTWSVTYMNSRNAAVAGSMRKRYSRRNKRSTLVPGA